MQKLIIARQYAAQVASANAGAESKEAKAAAQEVVKVEQEKQAQLKELANIHTESIRNSLIDEINTRRAASQHEYDLGEISNQQLYQQEKQYEDGLYAIQLQALDDKLALAAKDPDKNPTEVAKIQADREALEREHGAKLTKISSDMSDDMSKHWRDTVDAWGNASEQ